SSSTGRRRGSVGSECEGESMIVEYIRYAVADEAAGAALESAYAEAAASLDASEHCLGYQLARGVEEPCRYILRIEWDSREGHERGFRTSPEFRPFLEAVRPFIDAIEEMKHYELTTIAG